MRPLVRTTLGGIGFIAVFSLAIVSLALPVPHAAVAVLAAACMAPVVLAALAVAARWGIAAATRNSLTTVPAGFLVGACARMGGGPGRMDLLALGHDRRLDECQGIRRGLRAHGPSEC